MEENECMICLEEMKYNVAVLSCGHKYHFNCITSWANKKKDLRKICTICDCDNEIINVIDLCKPELNNNPTLTKKKSSYDLKNSQVDIPKKTCIIM